MQEQLKAVLNIDFEDLSSTYDIEKEVKKTETNSDLHMSFNKAESNSFLNNNKYSIIGKLIKTIPVEMRI